MPSYKLIAFTDPTVGQDRDYNAWYNNVHMADVVSIPGFKSAQRFVLKTVTAGKLENRYVAIYEMETDDPEGVMAEVGRRAGTEVMVVSPALDAASENSGIFEPCSDIVFAPNASRNLAG